MLQPASTRYAFASPAEAVAALLGEVRAVGAERVSLEDGHGRVLAEEVRTDRASPACDVSAMDGYALRWADLRPGSIPVSVEVRIGREAPELSAGTAARIVTGAPIPRGADTVVKREDVTELCGRIEIEAAAVSRLRAGASVRPCGENAPAASAVLSPGSVIGPAQVAALASVGCATPRVYRRVRAAVLVTGDELLPIDSRPEPWQLRDSNGPTLTALLGGAAYVQMLTRAHAPDTMQATVEALRTAGEAADVVCVTGGVSMGDRDFVPAALRELGARTIFHKLPQRPGKPILACVLPSGTPVLAFPGNPVSVLVTARRIGAPVVRVVAGFARPLDLPAIVTIDQPDAQAIDMWWHRPARSVAPGVVGLVKNAGSGDVMGVAGSDGFVEVPPNASGAGPWAFYPWGM